MELTDQITLLRSIEKCGLFYRGAIKSRDEMKMIIEQMINSISKDHIDGNVICTFNYISEVQDAFDVELWIPVKTSDIAIVVRNQENTEKMSFNIKNMPAYEYLSLIHEGTMEEKRLRSQELFKFAYSLGLNSDEFGREVFLSDNDPTGKKIEIQFIIHAWDNLFLDGAKKFCEKSILEKILEDLPKPEYSESLENRYNWIRKIIERLKHECTDEEQYRIISGCAHIFPKEPIDKISKVFDQTFNESHDIILSVDKVLEYMEKSPVWAIPPLRKDYTLYTRKNPRDPNAFAEAKTFAEKRAAYCFCPLIRDQPDPQIDAKFCYCGAGWFRQQWESVFKQPIKIEILHSYLKKDEFCEFAIHIPKDLANFSS